MKESRQTLEVRGSELLEQAAREWVAELLQVWSSSLTGIS